MSLSVDLCVSEDKTIFAPYVYNQCLLIGYCSYVQPLFSLRRLDYDHVPGHTYNLNIVATDNGTPARSGSASIRVSMMNFNDEDPVFVQPIEHVMVSEDALTNTVVHVVQAFDPDGDDVRYSFSG